MTRYCLHCGSPYATDRNRPGFCSDTCRRQRQLAQQREYKLRKKAREAKPNHLSIAEIERLARAEGISYGQYVVKHRL